MPGGYGRGQATAHDEEDHHAREFRHELTGGPPGDKSLVPQLLGWSYILTGVGVGVVTMRETALAGALTLTAARNALAVAVYVTVGIAVDAGKPWALYPAMLASAATLYVLGPAALAGELLPAVAAGLHAILLVAVPVERWLRDRA